MARFVKSADALQATLAVAARLSERPSVVMVNAYGELFEGRKLQPQVPRYAYISPSCGTITFSDEHHREDRCIEFRLDLAGECTAIDNQPGVGLNEISLSEKAVSITVGNFQFLMSFLGDTNKGIVSRNRAEPRYDAVDASMMEEIERLRQQLRTAATDNQVLAAELSKERYMKRRLENGLRHVKQQYVDLRSRIENEKVMLEMRFRRYTESLALKHQQEKSAMMAELKRHQGTNGRELEARKISSTEPRVIPIQRGE